MRPFIAAQRRRPYEAQDFRIIVTSAKLAEMPNFYTKRFVFRTNFLAAGWIAAGVIK